jgi:hypothetical protein
MSATTASQSSPQFRLASEMARRPVEWLWPGRLALGKVAVLEGDPGLGNSFLALDLCARLSAGRPWPDDAPSPAPAPCVYINGEDGTEATIGPRLLALGADLGRVLLLDRDDDLAASLSLPDQVAALEEIVARTRARLVVIDPVMQFLGRDVNPAIDVSIRRALAPLCDLARREGCHILLVRHLNKKGDGRALYRGLGSIGLVGTSRSAWLVAEEPGGSGRRVLAQVKNNLGPPQPSLAFEVIQGDGGAATLHWLGPVAETAESLLGRGRGREPLERQAAADFLTRSLADGPVKVRDLWKRVRAEGLSVTTVKRARKELGIRVAKVGVGRRAVRYFTLPEQEPPTAIDPLVRAFERQYPPRTPRGDED